MYPNPQDVRPLPPNANLEQYRKQAKDLVKACRSGRPEGIREWIARWLHDPVDGEIERFVRERMAGCRLNGAQFVIARAYGFLSWPKFAKHLEGLAQAE